MAVIQLLPDNVASGQEDAALAMFPVKHGYGVHVEEIARFRTEFFADRAVHVLYLSHVAITCAEPPIQHALSQVIVASEATITEGG